MLSSYCVLETSVMVSRGGESRDTEDWGLRGGGVISSGGGAFLRTWGCVARLIMAAALSAFFFVVWTLGLVDLGLVGGATAFFARAIGVFMKMVFS